MSRRLRDAVLRHVRSNRGDEGSLPMVMLLMLIGLAMGSVLVPTVLNQVRSTVFVASRENSLAAAQAGTDVVVSRIRAAATGATGEPSRLPCPTPAAPTAGIVGTPNPASYRASVVYYVVDPVKNPSAPPMRCAAGSGTFDDSTGATVPSFALITSTGTDLTPSSKGRSVGRTLVSTYVFRTSNLNVAGGQVRIYPGGGPTMCMDGSSSQPAAGTVLALGVCSTSKPPSQQQVFAYRSDLTLQVSTAATPGYPNGLCLDTDTSTGGPAAGRPIVLLTCRALGSPTYSQQWSFNDNGQFEASRADTVTSGTLSNLCMAVPAAQPTGAQVTLDACDADGLNIRSPRQAWLPVPSVGDGAAAAPQLVNYQQFGRCLDVANTNVDTPYMYIFPCKQNPKPGAVLWNQKFAPDPSTGWIVTTKPAGTAPATPTNTDYCLLSPRVENAYVRTVKCTDPGAGISPDQLKWTSTGSSAAVPYSQRYTFVDSSTDAKRCLSITAPPASDTTSWFRPTVATCDGTATQKWNADPTVGLPSFQNTNEK